ncbi:MAG TPA: substrate-binding domain-containing protein [Terrimicrobiaceae bacterium]|nr:substrate-binding domain-containing protein [Terrimicrobiaceae bacterium]
MRPFRLDFISSVVDALMHSIQRGEWGEYLPSERQLCKDLQVGRSSLRKAIVILRKNRVLDVAHGKRTRILKSQVRARVRKSKVVAALVKGSPESMDAITSWRLNNLQHDLHAAGMTLEIFCEGNEIRGLASLHIEKLLATRKAACWVVFAGNHHIQELFHRHHVNSFLVGTPHPGIDLPYVDIDFRAACRHAAGQLLRLGHKNIALIARNVKFPGTMASIEGFLEVAGQHAPGEVSAQVIKFDDDVRAISPLLKKIMKSSAAPTGVLTISAELALMTLTSMISIGLSVPHDVSLISRDFRHFLQYTEPAIAGYDINHSLFRKRLTKAVLELVDAGSVTTKAGLIVPEMRAGRSLAAARG